MMGKRLGRAVVIGVGAAAAALMIWAVGLFSIWEFAAWRWRVDYFAAPGAATSKINLILLDQGSLDWGEEANGWTWPWPREVYAPIIDFSIRSGARAIAFDMLFLEPSPYGVEDDRALGEAIERAPVFAAPVFLGRRSGTVKRWPPGLDVPSPLGMADLDEWLSRLSPEAVEGLVMPTAKFPVPEVSAHSTILASAAQAADFDGIFRRFHLFKIFDGRVLASLGLAAFLAAGADDSRPPPLLPGVKGAHSPGGLKVRDDCLEVAERCIPIDPAGRAIPRFRGSTGAYRTFSAAEVIQSELRLRQGEEPVIEDLSVFRDSYVFFGASAPGLLDLKPTPISKVSPGVEIHATLLDNFLSGDFLRDAPTWSVILTTLLMALAGSTLVLFARRAWQSALVVGILLPLPVLIGFLAYPLGYWWPVVVHEAAAAMALTAGVFHNYAGEGRRRAFIKEAFKYYLSPQVIERILEDPSRLELGGEHRELTIFFSDLEGFSSFSERLDPHTLTSLLNDYLSDMTDIILEEGGTLDKYEGDAIVAFWNAPLDQPDHARRACRAAIRCQRKLNERRDDFLKRTGALLLARIGIHTGRVVVGNMGSTKRFNYTILGDAANLASRLEGANKVFGTSIMVSEATWLQTRGEFPGREIGVLRVAGRKSPVRVYEPMSSFNAQAREERELFESALALYYAGEWAQAFGMFRKLPNDPVARVYAKRCQSLILGAGAHWEGGVWTLKGK